MARTGEIVFVTGADTGVGKTVVTALLTQGLNRRGVSARPMKPFSSGGREDAEMLREAAAGRWSLDEINPFAFALPLTPLLAAEKEGREISLGECLQRIHESARDCEMLLVEGAGGLMSPLGPGYDTLTLIRAVGARSVFVSIDRLGVINQVLTHVTAMEAKGCRAPLVVLNRFSPADASRAGNAELLPRLRADMHLETLLPILLQEPGKKGLGGAETFLQKTLAALIGPS